MAFSRVTLTSAILLATGCREPTQVQIELRTDALCDDVRETSITISGPGELEQALSDTSTDNCSIPGGRIGSLTVVPNDDDDAEFGVRVVTGLGKSASQCADDKYQGGCIVARRSLRFIPHKTLHLPIELDVVCRDIPCGATQTCSNGHCVDAAIDDVSTCLDLKGCTVAEGATSGGGSGTIVGGRGGLAGSTDTGSNGGAGGLVAASGNGNTGMGGTNQGGNPSFGGTSVNGGSTAIGGASNMISSVGSGGFSDTQGGMTSIGGGGTGGIAQANGGSAASAGTPGDGGTTVTVGNGGSTATGGTTQANGGNVAFGGNATNGGTPGDGGTTDTWASSNAGAGNTSPTGGTTSAGGSSTTGEPPAVCGDAVLSPFTGESCDSGGNSTSCNANCTPARCGDGVLNPSAAEACDGSTGGVYCTPSCSISRCGDGYVDLQTGEQCESGMGGCNACVQDLAGRADALRVAAERDELLLDSVSLNLEIRNTGAAAPIAGLVLRYYYTPDSSGTQSTSCTFSNAGCSNVVLQAAALGKSCSKASHYVQVSFKGNASLLKGDSMSVQARVSGGLLSLYDFSNDYSRPQLPLLKTETATIALYQSGRLVWGTPPCGCGNGVIDPNEQCDHAGESAFCNSDCTIARCGDNKINTSAGENCDTGAPSLTCSPECRSTGLPASASASLLQWLDPSHPGSVTLSPHVARLQDRSGRANHVEQVIPEKQPFWFPAAFGVLPALYFDGKLHELTAASPVNGFGSGAMLLVHHVAPVGLSATLAGNGWFGSGGGFAIRTRPQLDGLGIALGTSTGYATVQWTAGASGGSDLPRPRATYWAWNPPSFTWSTGGVAETLTATATYTSTSTPFALGGVSAGEPFTGWIGELLMFDRELSIGERDAILNYLRSKWGVN